MFRLTMCPLSISLFQPFRRILLTSLPAVHQLESLIVCRNVFPFSYSLFQPFLRFILTRSAFQLLELFMVRSNIYPFNCSFS